MLILIFAFICRDEEDFYSGDVDAPVEIEQQSLLPDVK